MSEYQGRGKGGARIYFKNLILQEGGFMFFCLSLDLNYLDCYG